MAAPVAADPRPLVVHIVYRFDVGGLENGVVNLLNHMPPQAYRHAVLSLTEISDFKLRVQRPDVQFIALNKPPGHGLWLYARLARVLRDLRPAVVHTRNLAALEMQIPAAWAAVHARVHGEHGRDVGDLDGSSRRYQWLRRAYRPFVHQYVALSRDLGSYLHNRVGIPSARITQIYNGVDAQRFAPAPSGRQLIEGSPFTDAKHWLVGTVGRMQTVKDQPMLARAFIQALALQPALRERLRLVMVGDGPLRAESLRLLQAAGVAELAWLPGERADVPAVLRGLDCFALPSLAEGVSNTILEAMATGLPVVATDVGGNAELVTHGSTGEIVPPADAQACANALLRMAADPARARAIGKTGREVIERRFSMGAMVAAYQGVYDKLLGRPSG